MLKRLLINLAILAGLIVPVHAAGTISFSLSQQFDTLGKPLAGCRLYFYQAGTTATPQNAYQDSGLTNPLPNPLECDAAGRLPQFYLADGQIKIRLTDKNGVTQVVADNLLVIGPSSGGGGGGGDVDATTILATGDVKARYGTGSLSGFVRLNGRTIGSATSGATERANADTQALFEYLWGADSTLTVSGGRGASAAADWAANKTIALPDGRGRSLAALADMGTTSSTLYDDATFTTGNATTLGSTLGAATKTIARSDLPNVAPTFTGTAGTVSVNSTTGFARYFADSTTPGGGFGFGTVFSGNVTVNSTGTFTPVGTVQSLNGGVAQTTFQNASPFLFITYYIKL